LKTKVHPNLPDVSNAALVKKLKLLGLLKIIPG